MSTTTPSHRMNQRKQGKTKYDLGEQEVIKDSKNSIPSIKKNKKD